jgi:hypothetical protein
MSIEPLSGVAVEQLTRLVGDIVDDSDRSTYTVSSSER